MRVLLVHPEDAIPAPGRAASWDMVVDLARAPAGAYERASAELGCSVLSLYHFADSGKDLDRLQFLLRGSDPHLQDRQGIDWWDVLSVLILREMEQFVLLGRLAEELRPEAEIFSTRADYRTAALEAVLPTSIRYAGSRFLRRANHYREVMATLDFGQIRQIAFDKFDASHKLRRRFSPKPKCAGRPVVLLPTAYSNVSRTLVAYAKQLPEQNFLLVFARGSAQIGPLPRNVQSQSLDSYFSTPNREETEWLQASWRELEEKLPKKEREFRMARQAGVLGRIAASIPWGLAMRDAWGRLFESEEITACFSADGGNPYTRMPLIQAKRKGLPTVVCHHGALDFNLRMKTHDADFYLAKSEMERDYLEGFCGMDGSRIVGGAASEGFGMGEARINQTGNRLTFFTEPYRISGWRSEEICREVLPVLVAVAEQSELRLTLKIHPFESVKDYKRSLKKYLREVAETVQVLAGPPTPELWRETRLAVTVESSAAVECAAKGIPVFLLGWLRESYLGYVEQFARFGVGRIVDSANELRQIPNWLKCSEWTPCLRSRIEQQVNAQVLRELLAGRYSPRPAPESVAAGCALGA